MAVYSVDERDEVKPLNDVPVMDSGAPCPTLSQSDEKCRLTYGCCEEGKIAIIEFEGLWCSTFGYPNDEALSGHPLYKRGLTFYSTFEIVYSSWIRAIERANRVHPLHDATRFAALRHFVWTFHDSTFECIAEGYNCRTVEDAAVATSG